MKRTVKIFALVLVFAMAVTALVGCGKRLSGVYEGTSDDGSIVLLTFDGKEFIYTKGTTQLKGTYVIEKDGDVYAITMTCDEEVVDGDSTKHETPHNIYEKTRIRIGDDYISIGSDPQVRKYIKK